MFGYHKTTPLESKDLLRMGRLEAEVATIHLEWVSYRDELRRLVNRLEKRAQRDEKKALENEGGERESATTPRDVITERVLRRRDKHVHA